MKSKMTAYKISFENGAAFSIEEKAAGNELLAYWLKDARLASVDLKTQRQMIDALYRFGGIIRRKGEARKKKVAWKCN